MLSSPGTTVRALLTLVALCVVQACGEAPASPDAHPPLQPRLTSYDSTTRTLYVSINGVNRATTEGWYTFRANSYSPTMHYDWLQQYCYNDFAYCSDFELISSQVGVDSLRIEYPGNIGKMRLALVVWDGSNPPWSGEYTKTIIGPAPVDYTNPTFGCQIQDTRYYPILDFDGRYFRRDACTGAKVYAP